MKDYIKSELAMLDRGIVATPHTREDLMSFANANKPTLSQDDAIVLVERLQDVFQDALNDADTSDLSPEFSIDYGNEVRLDCIDMSAIEIHACDIESVLEEVFNIVSDNS